MIPPTIYRHQRSVSWYCFHTFQSNCHKTAHLIPKISELPLGKLKKEGHALLGVADMAAAVMLLQDFLYDIEPQAAPSCLAAAGRVHPVEGFEQLRDGFLRDMGAGVLYGKLPAALPFPDGDFDYRFRRGVFHGIPDQIGEHLYHEAFVGMDGDGIRKTAFYL